MLLSSVVIILVSGTFLVQSQYYSSQTLSVSVHDNARVATDRLASEVRSTMEGGFVVAGPRTLTIRTPIALAVVCDRQSNDLLVHIEGGETGMDTQEVAGVAKRDPGTGAWTYQNATWASMDGGSAGAAGDCAANGADTSWATSEFHELLGVNSYFTSSDPGDVLMLFRQTTFRIRPSVLDTMTLGLFRQRYGGPPIEFATGMDTTARFQYRTGGVTYADTVSSGSTTNIDALRIVADARLPARSALQPDATFGWSVNVAVRNLP